MCLRSAAERLLRKIEGMFERSGSETDHVILADPRAEMARFTLDVILYLSMGYDLNSLENSEKEQVLADSLNAYFTRLGSEFVPSISWKLRRLIDPSIDRDFAKAKSVVAGVIKELIAQNRQEVLEEQQGKISAQSNLLKEMIRVQDGDDAFTDDELRGEVNTIMGAGLDTTSILLSFAHCAVCLVVVSESLSLSLSPQMGSGEAVQESAVSCDLAQGNRRRRWRVCHPHYGSDFQAPYGKSLPSGNVETPRSCASSCAGESGGR